MNKDIGPILENWLYEGSENLVVRKIIGDDGKEKIQLRLEMGILQMEVEGRPDGMRPFGCKSLLEYYNSFIEPQNLRNDGSDFQLEKEDCAELRRESLQYYHRRISFIALAEYEKAERDADHNLQIIDLLKRYAVNRDDWLASEQYRPFVLSHRTEARAMISLEKKDFNKALSCIEEGIEEIEKLFKEYGREDLIENSVEIVFLKGLKERIIASKPLSLKEKLQAALAEAVRKEEFERAAQIRDRLRELG